MEFVKWENTLDSREKEKKVFFEEKGNAHRISTVFFSTRTHTTSGAVVVALVRCTCRCMRVEQKVHQTW